jgi:hypothetical protein
LKDVAQKIWREDKKYAKQYFSSKYGNDIMVI